MVAVKDRDLVVPGTFIGRESEVIHDTSCFIEDGNVYSAFEGMVRVEGRNVKVVPSSGAYTPKDEDVVIGVIVEELGSKWLVDINSPYLCPLSTEETEREENRRSHSKPQFKVGDIITAKVMGVNEVYDCRLIKPWKMEDGLIIDVDPKRVPRVVGKKKSMLNIIREKTGCRIIVGQNGKIWIKDGDVDLAVRTIKRIEREAQSKGLTDKIAQLLEGDTTKI